MKWYHFLIELWDLKYVTKISQMKVGNGTEGLNGLLLCYLIASFLKPKQAPPIFGLRELNG